MTEQIDYLDAFMNLFLKSPNVHPSLKKQISVLQQARQSDKDSDLVSIPFKVPKVSEEEE